MYDGLENLAAHAGELKGKAAEAFQERVDDVLRNRQINALVLDLDLPLGPDDLLRRPWDREATHQLFDGLEFRVLRDRLLEALPNEAEIVPEGGFDVSAALLEPGELAGLAGRARGRRAHRRGRDRPLGFRARGHHRSCPGRRRRCGRVRRRARPRTGRTRRLSSAWFADPERHKAMHDAKGPLLAIWSRGWDLAGLTSDTQLAAYLTRPDQRTFDLADLTIRYLKRELKVEGAPEVTDSDQLSLDFGDDDSGAKVAAEASMVRARAVIDLADALDTQIEERNGTSLLYGVELPLLRTLARMEQTGVAVDVDHLEMLESEFGAKVNQAAADAYAVLGKQINLGSPKQLQVVLFDELGMPKTRRTKTGYTTDADALQSAVRQDRAPVPGPPAGAPRRHPAEADGRGAAQVRGRRRPDPHHVRADHRRYRPAVQHRPEPAEHPDPHRGGAADPPGVRRRAWSTTR